MNKVNHGSRQRSSNISGYTNTSKSGHRHNPGMVNPIQEDEYNSVISRLGDSSVTRKQSKPKPKKAHFKDEEEQKQDLMLGILYYFCQGYHIYDAIL